MAENYFDTQALLGVVIRDPKILGADITGTTLSINPNYDYPESGKPFKPGYYFGLSPESGFSVFYANDPMSGGLVMETLNQDHQYVPWYFDRFVMYTGSISARYFTDASYLDGRIVFRENSEYNLSQFPNTQQYSTWGVNPVGEFIITERQVFNPYDTTDGITDEPVAAVGVSSRASLSVNPQNVTKVSQMVMRAGNQGDTAYALKDTILEIDKAGAAITPKIGPGTDVDMIKIISGALASGNTRASIELSSSGSSTGIADVAIIGRLIAADPYSRANSTGRIMTVGSTGSIGYTQTPAMTRAWATSTVTATLASTTHGYQVGSTSGANIAIGTAEIVGRNNGAAMKISIPGGIGDLPVPTQTGDAATKSYVDAAVGSGEADTGWLDCTLASGWTPSTAAGQAPTVQCRKIGNRVRFRGRASGTLTAAATTTIVSSIPVSCRPPIDSNMNAVATTGGFTGWSNATSAGVVSVHFKTPFVTGAAVIEFTGMSYLID